MRVLLTAFLLVPTFVHGQRIGPGGGHWAFQPLNPGRERSIDAIVRRSLSLEGLDLAPRADARTLSRRAHFSLTGLPPAEGSGSSGGAVEEYADLIDRLLDSPQYGEHWARHWLDISRYSDTKGYVYSREEKNWVHASAYRDWVVRALNDDLPYDRFLLLQIAADQVVPPRSPDLAAMGFLTLGRRFLGVTHDIIDDRIDVVMRGTQALTVACARCHDHKFDPVPTRDYYALYGVFQSCAEALVPCSTGEEPELAALVKKNLELRTKRREEQMARTRARANDYLAAQRELWRYPVQGFDQILDANDLNPFIVHRWTEWLHRHPGIEITAEVLEGPESPAFVPDEHIANIEPFFPTGVTTELWKAQAEVDRFLIKRENAPTHALILTDRLQPSVSQVFHRGNPLNKGEVVPRQYLSLFGDQKPFTKGSGRLELAQAIMDPGNPLTARVMVNRIWQHHFGRGIVATSSDFGKQGSLPSHPELLDWLAAEFIRSGWSIKHMHRLIMLSETYQQRSETGEPRTVDASRLRQSLALFTPHRLSFEEARDAWLAAAGRLDLRLGGRPQPLFAEANTRRTLYSLVDRENLPTVLRVFDFANPDLSIPQRSETTVPQQALFVLNHPFVMAQAKALAKRSEVEKTPEGRIARLYRILFQREPEAGELSAALAFVSFSDARTDAPVQASRSQDVWAQLVQVFMLSNEFLFVD
jgi:hypothetical protein